MNLKTFQEQLVTERKKKSSSAPHLSYLLDQAQKIAKAEKRELKGEDIVLGAKRCLKQSLESQNAGMDAGAEISCFMSFILDTIAEDTIEKYIMTHFDRTSKIGDIMSLVKNHFGDNVNMKHASGFARQLTQ